VSNINERVMINMGFVRSIYQSLAGCLDIGQNRGADLAVSHHHFNS